MAKRTYRENDASVGKDYADGGAQYAKTYKGGVSKWKMRDGNNLFRILPRTWEDDEGPRHWAIPLFLHGGVGADRESYICPVKMGVGPCPICEERARVVASDEHDEDYAYKLKPYAKYVCYVIDRNNESVGPLIGELSGKSVHNEIVERALDVRTGKVLTVDHPEKGYDISFNRSGSGLKTKYTRVEIDRDPSFLAEREKDEDAWLDFIEDNPLPSLFLVHDYETIERAFNGGAKPAHEGDEDEDRPRTRRSSRDDEDEDRGSSRRKSRSRYDDDDMDGEGDDDPPRTRRRHRDEDDEEEEEERPRTRRRSRDEDDEEDERPRRKSRSRSRDEEDEEDPPRTRRRSRSRDEDDEEDPPRTRRRSRDDEDEEEERPRRKSRSRSRDDEDEEEERPRRRRRSHNDDEDEIDDEEEALVDDPNDDGPARRAGSRGKRGGGGSRGDDDDEERESLRDRVSGGLKNRRR